MNRNKVDATEIYAFEFVKCVLTQRGDLSKSSADELVRQSYALADLLYDEWQKRFDEIEEEELVTS